MRYRWRWLMGRWRMGRWPVGRWLTGRWPVGREPLGRWAVDREPLGRWPAGLVLLMLLCFGAGAAQADTWTNLWSTREQQAQKLLDSNHPAAAAPLFNDARRRAYAELQAGQYAEAAKSLAPFKDADSQYNRGNALAHSGQLREALSAYDAALTESPGNKDVMRNRDLVRRALERQQQNQSGKQGGANGRSGSQGSKGGQPQAGNQSQGSGQPQAGNQSQGSGQPQAGNQSQGSGQPQAGNQSQGSGQSQAGNQSQDSGQSQANQTQNGSQPQSGGQSHSGAQSQAGQPQGANQNQRGGQSQQNSQAANQSGNRPSPGNQSPGGRQSAGNASQAEHQPQGDNQSQAGGNQARPGGPSQAGNQAQPGAQAGTQDRQGANQSQGAGQPPAQAATQTPARPGDNTSGEGALAPNGQPTNGSTGAAGLNAENAQQDANAALQYRQRQQGRATAGGDHNDTGKATILGPDAKARSDGEVVPPKPPSEQSLALDQWLRGIPDDSGELLRRKFLIEHMLKQQREQQ